MGNYITKLLKWNACQVKVGVQQLLLLNYLYQEQSTLLSVVSVRYLLQFGGNCKMFLHWRKEHFSLYIPRNLQLMHNGSAAILFFQTTFGACISLNTTSVSCLITTTEGKSSKLARPTQQPHSCNISSHKPELSFITGQKQTSSQRDARGHSVGNRLK